MAGPGNDGFFVRRVAVLAVALVLGTPLVGSCGGSSRSGAGNAPGSSGDSNAGAAGTGTGGTSSAGGTSGEGGKQAGGAAHVGGVSTGGASTSGGNASAGEAVSGGAHADAGGERPAGGAAGQGNGFPCGEQRCSAGQSCTRCLMQNQTPQLCVPNPDQDPSGYASAIAACEAPPFGREDCDGPEDCDAGQFCVAAVGTRCQDQASTKHFCCFACNQITDCTLCHTDQDCPTGETCQPNQVADSKGCRLAQ
jgi:hypothetical protein